MPKAWYVAATKYQQERLADIELRKQGFETFAPRIRVRERIGVGGKNERDRYVIRYYFPGYIFVRFDKDRERWQSIHYTRGVSRLFTCGEVPTRIRGGVIERMIAEAVRDDFAIDDKLNEIVFEAGQAVKITAGPFAGLSGVVKASSHEKISVLLEARTNLRMKIKPLDFAPDAIEAA